MTEETRTPKPLIRRTTAMADAMLAAAQQAGIDTTAAVVRQKTEPAWTVTRREDRKGNRRGRR